MLTGIYKRKIKPRAQIICKKCGIIKEVRPSMAKITKYCSKECAQQDTLFKKGSDPWNKNIKIDMSKYKNYGMSCKRHSSQSNEQNRIKHIGTKVWNDGLTGYIVYKQYNIDKSNPNYINCPTSEQLTDRVYRERHQYVNIMHGLAKYYLCVDCGVHAKDWSNADHTYSFNLDEYQPRCRKCHTEYDKKLIY